MIANLILIVVVLGVAFAIIRRFITKRQNEESDEKMQVDDRTYTLEMMISFVKRRLDEITKINLYDIGLSEEELKRRKNKFIWYRTFRRRIKKKKEQEIWIKKGFKRLYIWRCKW